MFFIKDRRRRAVLLLSLGVVLFFALLGVLQWFNTSGISFLNPETSGETLAFTALTVVLFLLLILMLLLLLRNVLKLYADQGSSALGARLRTRMVLGAALIALMPAVLMFLFSFQLMNRSIDRWFSPNTSELRDDSNRVVQELAAYVANNARVEAESIVTSGVPDREAAALQDGLASHRITLTGGFVIVYGTDRRKIGGYEEPGETNTSYLVAWLDEGEQERTLQLHGDFSDSLLEAAQRTDKPVMVVGGHEYELGMARTGTGKIVVVALPIPQGLSKTATRIRAGAAAYWQLFRLRHRVRSNFLLLLLLVTVLVFFSSVWLAMFLSKQITRPVSALADAMDEIAAGKYAHRVGLNATAEMGELVRSFNRMAADLEHSREMAETSSAQLTTANQALDERRRELETILETIPSGVVTLDNTGKVVQANRAFAALMGFRRSDELPGRAIESLLPPESADELGAVIRRGHRMGAAFTELELHARGRAVHLGVTSARLDLAEEKPGTVLVVEDTTELLRAQRQLAWKEVAQRVAHEIKNPLTPIALSAERIGRHVERSQPDSPGVIRKCADVILTCVSSLRQLVDQFSALAQFPVSQPRACDVNHVIDESLGLFSGRLDGITVKRDLEAGLPPVMADPEAIRRALANLIDNAAEAMQGSLLRVLGVRSSLSEDGTSAEVTVSDTGHGLTDDIRERLFLPFYSTKNRGSGLGLSIAAKIAQEHGGSIRAESNAPKGARFILRVPLTQPVAPPAANGAESESAEPVREARR